VVRGVEKDNPDANTPLEGLSIMLPLALSDDQLDTVMRGAEPLLPQDRHKYLQRVAELLYQQGEIGDGAVARVCREAQRAFFDPPTDTVRHGRINKYA
jgi:hypothetical protein